MSEFYKVQVDRLIQAGLDKDEVVSALSFRKKKEELAEIHSVVQQRFAHFFTENQTALPCSGTDEDQGSAYFNRLESINRRPTSSEVAMELDEEDIDEEDKKHNELVRLLTETADLVDKAGFVREAQVLDDMLINLL